MYREKILARADEFLSRIGDQISYTTVPKVLNNGRIPSNLQATVFRAVETLVIQLDLVELSQKKMYTPGGFWRRLRLSPKGYGLVAARYSIRQILPPEELIYNQYRAIFEELDQLPEAALPYHELKKRVRSQNSRYRSFRKNIRHFEQLGWLKTHRTESGETMVRLGLESYDHYISGGEAIRLIRQRPYQKISTKIEERVPGYLEAARARHRKRRERMALEREIRRLELPGVPVGIVEKILFHTTRFGKRWYGPQKIYPEGSVVLTDEQRRKLSKITGQEVIGAVTFLSISAVLLYLILLIWP